MLSTILTKAVLGAEIASGRQSPFALSHSFIVNSIPGSCSSPLKDLKGPGRIPSVVGSPLPAGHFISVQGGKQDPGGLGTLLLACAVPSVSKPPLSRGYKTKRQRLGEKEDVMWAWRAILRRVLSLSLSHMDWGEPKRSPVIPPSAFHSPKLAGPWEALGLQLIPFGLSSSIFKT